MVQSFDFYSSIGGGTSGKISSTGVMERASATRDAPALRKNLLRITGHRWGSLWLPIDRVMAVARARRMPSGAAYRPAPGRARRAGHQSEPRYGPRLWHRFQIVAFGGPDSP